MELINHKKEDEFIELVLSSLRPSSNSLSGISEANRLSLRELIIYLSKLRKDDIIDEKQFSELITVACANFIENEVEIRISRSINDRLIHFFEKI